MTQYERALSAANDKLQECFSRQNDYAQRLTDAKTAQQALKEQVAAAAQQVRTYSATLGENDSATIAAKANLDALKAEYRNSCAEVKKLTGQNTALKKTTQNAADAVTDATTKLNTAQAAVRSTQAEINQCNQSLRLAQTNWDAAGKSMLVCIQFHSSLWKITRVDMRQGFKDMLQLPQANGNHRVNGARVS